jgi:hypothetical protein
MDEKPERREYHNELNKKNKYYISWRLRKRSENEEEFLARNAMVQRAWHVANPEWRSRWDSESLALKLTTLKSNAEARTLPWELTDDQAVSLIIANCLYCDRPSSIGVFGSIDRVDNDHGYTPDNSVPSCKLCNNIKCCLDVATFLERCSHISGILVGGSHSMNPAAWMNNDHTVSSFEKHVYSAKSKNITWNLTLEEFASVQVQKCAFCHRPGPSSVDRIDNVPTYQMNTVQPLCTECNYMKKDIQDHKFLAHVVRISHHGAIGLFDCQSIPRQRLFMKSRPKIIL